MAQREISKGRGGEGHRLQKTSKESGIFQSFSKFVLFYKRQSQMGVLGDHGTKSYVNTLLITVKFLKSMELDLTIVLKPVASVVRPQSVRLIKLVFSKN